MAIDTQKQARTRTYEDSMNWDCIDSLVDGIVGRHGGEPGALIEVLHQVQEEVGFLPLRVQVRIAEGLGLSVSDVYGVATFYSLFSLKPRGKFRISICKGTACYVREASGIIERLEQELGIIAGDTTDDGMFSLEIVRCLGACGLGPVMMVNSDVHARLKTDAIPGILARYREGQAAGEESKRVVAAG